MNAFLELNKIYLILILNNTNTNNIYYKSALIYRYLIFEDIDLDEDFILNNSIDILDKLHKKYKLMFKSEYEENQHNFNTKNITIDESKKILDQIKIIHKISI